MNKIYEEPIKKAESLVEGVKKGADALERKGIVIDVEALCAACRELYDAGVQQDAAEARLKEARERAHNCLAQLKEIFNASKAPIKEAFPPESWLSFGLTDKK